MACDFFLSFILTVTFAGHSELAPDKEKEILVVKGLWWEPGIRQTKKLDSALDKALKEFSVFNDCKGYTLCLPD